MNIKDITKGILSSSEVQYNFSLATKGILITYSNEVFVVEHNQSLSVLLGKDIFNIKGWMFSEKIIGYNLDDKSSSANNILCLVFNNINNVDIRYVSIENMRVFT